MIITNKSPTAKILGLILLISILLMYIVSIINYQNNLSNKILSCNDNLKSSQCKILFDFYYISNYKIHLHTFTNRPIENLYYMKTLNNNYSTQYRSRLNLYNFGDKDFRNYDIHIWVYSKTNAEIKKNCSVV